MDDKILIGIVTAVAALAGVVLTQGFSLIREIFDRRYKKFILLREKFELLTESTQEAISWSIEASDCCTIGDLNKLSVNVPARRALSLSLIYFPEFRDACIVFQNSYISYYHVMVNSFNQGVAHSAGTQAAAHNRTAYEKAAKKFTLARQAIDDLIVEHSSTYAKA